MSLKAKLMARKGHPLEVADWGETVFVRSMTERELREYQEVAQSPDVDHHALMRAVVASHMLDEDGHRIFGDDEHDQVADLSFPGVREVYEAILRKTLPESAVEEAEGN